jgi:hypothetical protein
MTDGAAAIHGHPGDLAAGPGVLRVGTVRPGASRRTDLRIVKSSPNATLVEWPGALRLLVNLVAGSTPCLTSLASQIPTVT